MQKGSFTADTPIYDVEGVVYRINRLAQHFRDSDLPVIFVQHDGNGTGEFEKKYCYLGVIRGTRNYANRYIDKYANNVFYKSQLQSKLTVIFAVPKW